MVRIPGSVHIKLEQGLELRKGILEAALRSAQLIQSFKDYQIEDAEKKKLINKFKKQITSFKEKVDELEMKDLPHNVVKKVEQEIQEPIPEPVEEKPIYTPPATTEAEFIEQEEEKHKTDLEKELESLKTKIDNINI